MRTNKTDIIGSPKIKMEYHGPFFIELISILGMQVKRHTYGYKTAKSKLFKLFLELSQNVANYSEDRFLLHGNQSVGIGKLILKDEGDTFCFGTENLVKNSDALILYERCKLLNQSEPEDLRELKREMRRLDPGTKYGARIGLIQAVLISNNALTFSVKTIDKQHSLFTIAITIDKN
ncbi:MAG: SiaB family protein kinase [Bacteroidales bacterium]|jgi:hypothetical protein